MARAARLDHGIAEKERILKAYWTVWGAGAGEITIALEAVGLSEKSGYLHLVYEFPNFDAWLKEHEEKKNAAF